MFGDSKLESTLEPSAKVTLNRRQQPEVWFALCGVHWPSTSFVLCAWSHYFSPHAFDLDTCLHFEMWSVTCFTKESSHFDIKVRSREVRLLSSTNSTALFYGFNSTDVDCESAADKKLKRKGTATCALIGGITTLPTVCAAGLCCQQWSSIWSCCFTGYITAWDIFKSCGCISSFFYLSILHSCLLCFFRGVRKIWEHGHVVWLSLACCGQQSEIYCNYKRRV